MTLRRKIALQILAMIVGLLLVSGAALWGLNGLHQDYGLALQGYQELRQVYTVGSHLSTARMLLTLSRPGGPEQVLIDREIRAAAREFESFTPSQPDAGGASAPDQAAPAAVVRQALADAEASTATVTVADENTARLDAQADAVNRALGGIAELGARIRESTQAQQQAALVKRRQTIVTVAVLSGAIVLAGVLLGILQYRSVIRPLRRLSEGVRRIAAGQFSGRVRGANAGRDELASLARDFNRMARELDGLYRELEQKVEAKSRELVRSERLAGVGYLAAGVAHEINNPLGIIAGYAEFSLSLLNEAGCGAGTSGEPESPELVKNLRVICDETFRCKQITEKLLSLARPSEAAAGAVGATTPRRRLSLGTAAAEVASILGGLPPYRDRRLVVKAKAAAEEGAGPAEEGTDVLADESEMKQVLLNLTLNALEAVPGGGEVRIELSRKGHWVELSVSDNGRGMSEQTLQHVFEPFFTDRRATQADPGASPVDVPDLRGREREAGLRGTGLGLSITHAIVQSHGGRIEAFSDGPGRGSRFVVTLPAAPDADVVDPPIPAAAGAAGAAKEVGA